VQERGCVPFDTVFVFGVDTAQMSVPL
jgi:hypothetical protein